MGKRSLVIVTLLFFSAAWLSCGGGWEPFHGEWVYNDGDVDRVIYTFETRNVEMRQYDGDGELRWHWTGRHDLDPTSEGFEGTIVFRRYLDEGSWESWDFTNDHTVRLVLEDEETTMRFFTSAFGEWEETDYSPLVLRE